MTTAIATASAFPRMAFQVASSRMFRIALALALVASLTLNLYYFAAASRINSDLVEAGIVQAPASTGFVDMFEMSIVAENVKSVAISAAQAAAAAQQLQQALIEAQAAGAQ